MKLDFCAVCGSKVDLVQHHVIPVVYSSKVKRQVNIKSRHIPENESITLCNKHHKIIHGLLIKKKYSHHKMIKAGLDRARASGIKLGRPTNVTPEIRKFIINDRLQKISIHTIARRYRVGVGTVRKICYDSNQEIIKNILEQHPEDKCNIIPIVNKKF